MTRLCVGDRVRLASGLVGTVVGVVGRQEYARNLEAWRWAALTEGLLILLDDGAFEHVGEAEVRPLPPAGREPLSV